MKCNEDDDKVPISMKDRINDPWVYAHIGTSSANNYTSSK